MEFSVAQQDIIASETDAIVIPAGVDLGMTSSIARTIREHNDGAIYDDLQRYDPVDGGTAVVTPGYDIAEYLIHAVATGDENTRAQNVRAATDESLTRADQLACDDIAVPLLGSGYGNLSAETSVKIIGETIDAYGPDRLSAAQVVCNDASKYTDAAEICSDQGPWVGRSL